MLAIGDVKATMATMTIRAFMAIIAIRAVRVSIAIMAILAIRAIINNIHNSNVLNYYEFKVSVTLELASLRVLASLKLGNDDCKIFFPTPQPTIQDTDKYFFFGKLNLK